MEQLKPLSLHKLKPGEINKAAITAALLGLKEKIFYLETVPEGKLKFGDIL